MSTQPITAFKVLCFDCYGTIVDWESPIYERLKPMLSRSSRTEGWGRREALLAFGNVEQNLQVQHPDTLYSSILEMSFLEFAKRLEIEPLPDLEEAKTFGSSIKYWPAYPDSVAALSRLSKHYKIVILSNVDLSSFSETKKILQPWTPDLVLTAQEIGSYKPAANNFLTMLSAVKEKFNVDKGDVLITAGSLHHDHEPANALGLRGAWIDRANGVMGVEDSDVANVTYDWKFRTLEEMADAVEAEYARA